MTKTQTKILEDGREARVVTGWNYTLHKFWFVVYMTEPGGQEVNVPARDAIDEDEPSAFRRGFEIAAAVDRRLLNGA